MSKKKLVGFFFERNYRVTPQLLEEIPSDFNFENFLEKNNNINRSEEVIVLDNELFKKLFNFEEESIVEDNITASVEVISSYVDKPKKREVKDFVIYMKVRYNALKKILLQRSELQNAISISRLASKQAKEYVSIIGFVNSKDQTRNGHYILELEDPTGITKILISAKNKELIELMDEVVLDELVGINGTLGENIVFANEFYFPDTPLKEYKKCKDDVSAVFISDLHIGSTLFAKKEFENFIMWVNGNYGNEEQKEVARKVKYIILPGDLIAGVGIHPLQEKELLIKDIYKQYEEVARYFSLIRKDIKIVVCAGNHDALRIAEPQPKLSEDFAKSLYNLKNVIVVSNPAVVKIHKMFDVLLYHGFSFDYYVNNVSSLRDAGGYENSVAVMEFFLKKRHFAPTHMSSLYIPDIEKDPLIIENIPDFFVTGHFHYDIKIGSYKNVSLIGCSSFEYMSGFQEKLGHTNICWGTAVVANLKTRAMSIVDFREKEKTL